MNMREKYQSLYNQKLKKQLALLEQWLTIEELEAEAKALLQDASKAQSPENPQNAPVQLSCLEQEGVNSLRRESSGEKGQDNSVASEAKQP
jgi:cell shape-determining protein MreC